MTRLADLVPEFVAELEGALEGEGRAALASQLRDAELERCAFDRELGAGYLHLRGAASPAAEKVSFREPHWFGVELEAAGRVRGIVLFSRDEVFARLRERSAPGAFVDV